MANAARSLGASKVDVINSDEGLLSLRFETAAAAAQAKARLELSGEVVSLSRNHLYRPALKISLREESAQERFVRQLTDPSVELPEVQLPPAQVTEGADPLVAQDWAMTRIGLPASQDEASAAQPVIAAVIDTGVDYNHEDLVGAMWRHPSNEREVGYDFAHQNARPYDLVHFDIDGCLKDLACQFGFNQERFLVNPGHGTHCAGHVGAVANNSLGIAGVGTRTTQIMGLKFFFDYGEENAGAGDDAAAIKSIDYAVQNGAKVISASWGGNSSRQDAEKSELKQALIRAQKAGVLVVVAAGNDGLDQETEEEPSFPAAYDLDNLIVVAATDPQDRLADFSNYGHKSVHIAAPGVKILSTVVGSRYSDMVASYKDDHGKTHRIDWDGTSMATPIVAGAVARVWAKFPNADYREIRERILSSARRVPALEGKVVTGGVLDVSAALTR